MYTQLYCRKDRSDRHTYPAQPSTNVATSATIRGVGAVLLLHPRVDKMATTPSSGRRLPALRRVLEVAGDLRCRRSAGRRARRLAAGASRPAVGFLSRVTQLLAAQQIDFRADQLNYNLLDLSLDLRDVTIRSPRRAQDPPFAVIGHLRADLSLVILFVDAMWWRPPTSTGSASSI